VTGSALCGTRSARISDRASEWRAMVQRFVRRAAGMMLFTALLGVVVRVGRKVLDRGADAPGAGAIRTGSFDSWPSVPNAPGSHRSGG